MAVVLAFPARPAKGGKAKGELSAEIVIFPGVRQERREFSAKEAKKLRHLPKVRANSRRSRRHPLEDSASPQD